MKELFLLLVFITKMVGCNFDNAGKKILRILSRSSVKACFNVLL